MLDLPIKERVYDNHVLNSEAWLNFRPRPDDVIITTSLKAGTTWMQGIVENLIFQGRPMPDLPWKLSPWLDRRSAPMPQTLEMLEAQTHRRCIKTHLPLDGKPFYTEVKYIFVGRDGRDIFMSFWNHYSHVKPQVFDKYNEFLGPRNERVEPCPADIHQFFAAWIEKSCFPWEREGYPYWSPLRHFQGWWEYRHLPNMLFVHFNDLLDDLDGEIRRIAAFLDIAIHEPGWAQLVDGMRFARMKERADDYVSDQGAFLEGGAQRFMYKGTNGRWHGVLTEQELQRYDAAVVRELDPQSRLWLEGGRSALDHGGKQQ